RVIWGVLQVLVAAVLLLSGGLEALQTISIVAALPFMVLMVFMAGALLKALANEIRQKELHEALLLERLQRLLEDAESSRASDDQPPPTQADPDAEVTPRP